MVNIKKLEELFSGQLDDAEFLKNWETQKEDRRDLEDRIKKGQQEAFKPITQELENIDEGIKELKKATIKYSIKSPIHELPALEGRQPEQIHLNVDKHLTDDDLNNLTHLNLPKPSEVFKDGADPGEVNRILEQVKKEKKRLNSKRSGMMKTGESKIKNAVSIRDAESKIATLDRYEKVLTDTSKGVSLVYDVATPSTSGQKGQGFRFTTN